MKKIKLLNIIYFTIVTLLLSVALFTGCGGDSDDGINPPHNRTFWAIDENNDYYQLNATLMAIGDYSIIYVEDTQLSRVTVETSEMISDEFDNVIFPLINTKFASASDVDGTGKITILILDIKDGYSGSGGYVAGYFDPSQLFNLPNSNRLDMIYMDCYPAVAGDSDFFITLAHELQHLVNFNKTYLLGGGKQQHLWINEGLSSAAEYLYEGDHIGWKIDHYNQDTTNTILKGNYFISWGKWGNILDNYSTVYLFFQWLRIHASNDSGIFKDILDSDLMDYKSVQNAANERIYSTQKTWEDLFLDWLAANLFNHDSEIHGYKQEFTLTPPVFPSGPSDTFPLLSGEAIYVSNSGDFSVPLTGSAKYAGLTTDSYSINKEISLSNPVILAYNTSADPNDEEIYLDPWPSIKTYLTIDNLKIKAPVYSNMNRTNYPIDMVFKMNSLFSRAENKSFYDYSKNKNDFKKTNVLNKNNN